MKIIRDSLSYKIAYNHPLYFAPPEETTLCRFFWRFVFSLLISWPLFVLAAAVLWVVFSLIFPPVATLVGFLFGYRPNQKILWCRFMEDGSRIMEQFQLPKMCGHKIFPVYLLVLGWIFYSFYFCISGKFCFATDHAPSCLERLVGVTMVLVCFLLIQGIASYGLPLIKNSKLGQYIKVSKSKLCPVVEFVEK